MDDRTRSCTWDVFCEHLASYAEDEDFILVVQDDIDLGPLNGLPKDKIFVSSPSDPNMILNAAGMALSSVRGPGRWPFLEDDRQSYSQIRNHWPYRRWSDSGADGGLLARQDGASRTMTEDFSLVRGCPHECRRTL